MSSHTHGRLLESPTDVYSHISHKLSEDGLNPECTDQEKLLFLWKLHQHQEGDLQKARETENKLKEAQAEEMKEVESYVEHIRHLSDEREALIQDLESENETLKAQVVALEKGDNEAAQAEITEMLTQQGLAEISDATQSEQIAFLLVERARLLDELEEQHNNSSSNNNTPSIDGRSSEMELKQILEQERGDFEETMSQHRESAKMMGDQLKQEHEEEINALMEENSKLEEDLQRAEMQVSQLKAELSRYEGDDQTDLNVSLNKSSSFSNEADQKKIKEERNKLNEEREEFENEINAFDEEKQQFMKEKQDFEKQNSEFETVKSNFKKEQAKVNQMRSEMEVERKEVTLTKDRLDQDRKHFEKKQLNLQNRKDDLENEREEFIKEKEEWTKENKESPQAIALRNQSPSRTSNDMALRKIIEEKTKIEGELMTIKTTLRSLQKEKDAHDDVVSKLKGDLEKCHVHQQQLQVKNRSLTHELQELEMQLDDTETSMDSITKEKQDLSEKYDSLNSEIKTLRADAKKSSTLQDIVDILNMDKKQLSESLESLKKVYEQTNTEKSELANQNNRLSKEEQELTNQLRACKEDLLKVEKVRDSLASEKSELLALKKKQEEVEALLRADLDEMVKMKEKFANQTEILSKENKELLNKLEKTREDLEGARISLQELARQQLVIDHLKDQNQLLQDQISSSHNELGSSKNRETMLITAQHSLQKNYEDTEKRFSQDIDDLKMKLELSLQELAKTKKQVEDLTREKSHLSDTLSGKDKIIQDFAKVKQNLEEEQRQKNSLQLDINKLQNQLAEKSILADKFDLERKQRLNLESQVSSLRDVEDSLKAVSRELDKEKKMRESLEDHAESLEKTLTTRVSKEEYTSAQDTADKERQLRNELEICVRDLEHKLKETDICSQSAMERLENEQGLRQSLEINVKDLQAALNDQGTAEELMRLREELNKERAALRELSDSKDDVELLCEELEKERSLRAELTRKIAELEMANGATSTLKATLDELDRERRARMECDMRLQEADQLLEEQRMESDTLHHSMSSKMMSLEKRIQSLQDDLFSAQDELQAFQDRYEEAVAETEALKMENKRLEVQATNLQQTQVSSHQSLMTSSTASSLHSRPPWREEEMTQDSGIGSQQLHETLNELNSTKSRLCRTEEELHQKESDIDSSRQEVSLLKRSLEQTTSQLEDSENDLRSIRQQLISTQESLSQIKFKLEEKQARLESMVQERDEIQRELDNLNDEYQQKVTPRPPDPSFYGEEERQEHVDRIKTLEKLSRQLELDNREMAMKLSDSISKRESLEEQVQREKLKNTDRYQQSSRYTDQLEHDLDTANQHIRQLREEMQQHQTKAFKIEADNLGLSAKYESTISRLEQENKDLKARHRQELGTLSQRMEVSATEARDLRGNKRELDQEVSQLRLEVSRLKGNKERLELLLQTETKQRQDLENRNSVIDNEMTKVWGQVRNLMEKNAELETSNRNQDQELSMKITAMRQAEATLSQKEASFETSNKALSARAELAEKKDWKVFRAKDLQRDLDELTQKLMNVEKQLVASDSGKIQLEDTKDRLATLRNQMEGEKLQRTLLDQTVAELKHQVALLKQRESKLTVENKDFQHTILDLESKLEQFQENISLGYDNHTSHQQSMTEVGKRSLMDQITRLQHEVKELQYELFTVSERRDVDVKRYEERKLRTKAKLMKARDFYTTERTKYSEHMKHLEDDLRLTRATLSKEVEWRDKMDDSYKQLLREKRELITQLSEVEENLRDKARLLSMAQVKTKYLEEENSRLQERVHNLTQQKHHLDKLLRDFGKREKIRVMSPVDHTVGTSGLGNSLDSAWDPNDMGVSWSSHADAPGLKTRHNNNMSSAYSGVDSADEDDNIAPHGKRLLHFNNNNNNTNNHSNISKNNNNGNNNNNTSIGPHHHHVHINGSSSLPRATGAYTLYRDDNDHSHEYDV